MKLAFASLAILATAACTTNPPKADDPAYALTGGKADSTWCHVQFDSVESTSIRVDYQIASTTTEQEFSRTAQPLWLNVARGDLGGAQAVRVWMGDEMYSSEEGYDLAAQYNLFQSGPAAQVDLYRSEDPTRFTGPLAAGLPISEYWDGDDQATIHAHQFAIVIDGTWQTDPISGTHNFVTRDLGGCGE